jgi:hypothetical protein
MKLVTFQGAHGPALGGVVGDSLVALRPALSAAMRAAGGELDGEQDGDHDGDQGQQELSEKMDN